MSSHVHAFLSTPMSPSIAPLLPVELFHEVVNNLRDDLTTLKRCALACSTLRYIVQQHLFSEVTIHRFPHGVRSDLGESGEGDDEEDKEESLCAWLLRPAHMHLLAHVRHLRVQCYPPSRRPIARPSVCRSKSKAGAGSKAYVPTPVPDPAFVAVLEALPAQNLSRITVLRRHRDDPLGDTEGVVGALLKRSLALEELCVEDRRVFAGWLRVCGERLRVLKVYGTEFVGDEAGEGGEEVQARRWPRLETLVFPLRLLPECLLWMVMDGGSGGAGSGAVFPRLKNLFVGDEVKEVEVVNEVLEMCRPTLRSLVCTPYGPNFSSYPNPCHNQNGTVIEFAIPPSLRMLAINCPIMLKPASRAYPNPFGWLNYTLRKLSRHSCALEILHIKFLTTGQIEALDALFPNGFPMDLCFAEFDKLLSNKTRFPYLKKVYLTVGRHYLKLFADPETLPRLNERGVLGIIYEEVLKRRFLMGETGVDNLPWDGRVFSFS